MPESCSNSVFRRCPKTGRLVGLNWQSKWVRMFFPLASLLAMAWFVIRVVPQPNRIAYPCQQFAAATFGTYVAGALAIGLGFARRLRHAFAFVYRHAFAVGGVAALAGMLAVLGGLTISSCSQTEEETNASLDREARVRATPSPTFELDPYTDKTVVRVYDPTMSTFKVGDPTDYYYRKFDAVKMQRMLEQSLYLITGSSDPVTAWKAILPNVTSASKIAVKVNHNDVGFYPNDWYKSNNSDPPMMIALTKSLQIAGVQQANITFFDRSRNFPAQMKTDVRAQCPNVVMQGASDNMAMSSTKLSLSNWTGCDQYIPQVVMNADYLIDLFLFKSHDGGITGGMKNLGGLGPAADKILHNGHEWSGNKILPDLVSQSSLRKDYGNGSGLTSKWRLFISEAVFLCQNPTEYISSSVASKTAFFPGGLPSSLFVARSPFMIDNVLLDFMTVEKKGNLTSGHWGNNTGWTTNSVGRYTNWVSQVVSAGSVVTGGLDMPPSDIAYNASYVEFISVPNFYALTTNATNGTVAKSPAAGSNGKYTFGTQVTLTATPAAGYVFKEWTGDVTGTTNPATITITGAKNVTASFVPSVQYTLNLTTTSGGSVALNPPGGTYYSGTTVTLTATTNAVYTWGGFSGDIAGTANPVTITMNSNKNVTATFNAIPRYTLTTTALNGTVTLNPPGGSYYIGTSVTLTATGDEGYRFMGWSGDLSGATNPVTVTMNGNKNVVASFEAIPRYTITTSATNGTVTLNPPGGTYYQGTSVTLTAVPDTGFGFAGWDGDLVGSGTTNPVTVAMSSDLSAIANFAILPQYTLTISADNGSVTLNPPGGTYYAGTAVTLTATPITDYKFTGWSGDLSGTTNPVTVTMTGDKNITATFAYNPKRTLTTSALNGTITLNPPGGSYDAGTVVTLTATPSAGYTFSGWSGDLSGAANPTTLTMDTDKNVAATFTAIPRYALATTSANGSITLNPPGGSYTAGTVVTVTATAATGFVFSGWSGDLSGTTNPTTITMNGNKAITASFTWKQVATTYEAESLTRTASSVGSNTSNDANASGGVYVQLAGTPGVNAYLEFTTPSLAAATYDIKMLFKSNNSRGINKVSIDGTQLAAQCDEYAATAAFKVQCAYGSRAMAAGTHKIRFTTTGKNAASSGYTLTVDAIILTSTGP